MRTTTRRVPVGAVTTLVSACLAVAVLAAGTALTASPTVPEDLAVLVWVLGWVLVVWTAIAMAVGLVGVVRGGAAGRLAWTRVAVLLAGAAVLVAGVLAHPVVGSGGATVPAPHQAG